MILAMIVKMILTMILKVIPKMILKKKIRMIETNQKVSTADIAKELGLGIATVKRKIKKIPNISYVGSGNNGHWGKVRVEMTLKVTLTMSLKTKYK